MIRTLVFLSRLDGLNQCARCVKCGGLNWVQAPPGDVRVCLASIGWCVCICICIVSKTSNEGKRAVALPASLLLPQLLSRLNTQQVDLEIILD